MRLPDRPGSCSKREEESGGIAGVSILPAARPFVLAFSSASLLYIAMSDLIPDLHRGQIERGSARQVLLIAAGIGTVVLFGRLAD
jgi:zinc and cadmium transporter